MRINNQNERDKLHLALIIRYETATEKNTGHIDQFFAMSLMNLQIT